MAPADLVRRAARASSPIRALIKHPITQRVIQTERGLRVLDPGRLFLRRQLGGGTGSYMLPSGVIIHVRHRSRDIDIVNEIFGATGGNLEYEPPTSLGEQLSGHALRILDLGGNIGVFGAFALGRWQVLDLVSFEPDPDNADLLQSTIASNRAGAWSLRRAAVSNRDGTMQFVSGQLSESREASLGEQGIEVEVVDFFSLEHDVDLLKMDIEGGEWAILTDPRFPTLRARVIVMEWHWRFCPDPDPHSAALKLLGEAGYEVLRDAPGDYQGGTLWAARSGPPRAPQVG